MPIIKDGNSKSRTLITLIQKVHLLTLDGNEHTHVKRPEDSKAVADIY